MHVYTRFVHSDIVESPFRAGRNKDALVSFIGDAAHPMTPNLGQVSASIIKKYAN